MKKSLLPVLGSLLTACVIGQAQVLTDFESFADGTTPGTIMFRLPRYSGSTAGKLDLTPEISTVTATFPTGNSSTRALTSSFSFTNSPAVTDPWLRLTTFGATSLPNPTVDFAGGISFDIYSDRALGVALGLRETGTSAAIGANGGSTGTIEFIGASAKNGSAPIPLKTVAAGSWTTLVFDLPTEVKVGFTGDGVLTSATAKGVLESLALVPADGVGTYTIYLDNFAVVAPVPEPATCAVVAGLGLLGFAGYRRWQGKRA